MRLFIRALFSLILPITIAVIVPILVISGFGNHLLPFNSALNGVILISGTFMIVLGYYL